MGITATQNTSSCEPAPIDADINSKLAKSTYEGDAQTLADAIAQKADLSAINTPFRGAVDLSSPKPTLVGTYMPTQAGTYTGWKDKNNADIVIDVNKQNFISLDANGVFAVQEVAVDVSGKVDKTSIVDNLTSTDETKVLSAKQGKALKDYFDTEIVNGLNQDISIPINGKNLFDKSKIKRGVYVNDALEPIDENSAISNYIECIPNKNYWISGMASDNASLFISFYDINKNFLIRGSTNTNGTGNKITVPPNSYFMKFTVYIFTDKLDSVRLDNIMLEKWNDKDVFPTTFEPYSIVNRTLNDTNFQDLVEKHTPIQNAKVDLVGKNLFNKIKVTRSAYLAPSGDVVNSNPNSALSEFINCSEFDSFWISGMSSTYQGCVIGFYDKDKVFLISENLINGSGKKVTAPENVKFFRFSVYLDNTNSDSIRLDNIMVERWFDNISYPTTFEPYATTEKDLDVIFLREVANQEANSIAVFENKKTFWTGKKIILCGTSISDISTNKMKKVFENINVTNYVNNAQGGSSVQFNTAIPIIGLSATSAEKASNNGTQPSYEDVIMPFINTTDLFLFEHGWNDSGVELGMANIASTSSVNRNSYVGGMNYIIYEMKKANPFVRIGLIGHWNNIIRPDLIDAQKAISKRWNVPILNISEIMGGTSDLVNGTFIVNGDSVTANQSVNEWYSSSNYGIGDNVHPSNDNAVELMSDLISSWLKNNMM